MATSEPRATDAEQDPNSDTLRPPSSSRSSQSSLLISLYVPVGKFPLMPSCVCRNSSKSFSALPKDI